MATTLARVIVRLPLKSALLKVPALKLWSVVDDISGFVGGPRRLITYATPLALTEIMRPLQEQGLRFAAGKSKAMAWGLGDAAPAFWKRLDGLGVLPAEAVRSVGVDIVGAEARRTPIAQKTRL